MKKVCAMVCVLVFLILGSACAKSNTTEGTSNLLPTAGREDDNVMQSNCLVYVNGIDITSKSKITWCHEDNYAVLPFTIILEELGAKVEWINDAKVIIVLSEKQYILDTVQHTLVEEGKTMNMIEPPPGTLHFPYYQCADGEFFIDSDCAKYFLHSIGATVAVDYKALIININSV